MGQAAAEFALLAPLLAAIVFGMVDSGTYLEDRTAVSNAAREGARFASLSIGNAIQIAGSPGPAAFNTIQGQIQFYGGSAVIPNNDIDLEYYDSTNKNCASYTGLGPRVPHNGSTTATCEHVAGSFIKVIITYSYRPFVPGVTAIFGANVTIVETAEMVIQ